MLSNKHFKKSSIILFSIVIAVLLTAGFFASKIEFEEDISKIIPANEKLQKLNLVFSKSSFLERLVVNISLADTLAEANPDKLINYAEDFVQELKSDKVAPFINEITYQISNNVMDEVFVSFYNNLPLFLTKEDYNVIDTLISEASIKKTIQKDYKTLISPASVVLKKFLLQDPLSLTPIALKKLQNLQFTDAYFIYNGYILTQNKKNLLLFISPANASSKTAKNAQLLNYIDQSIDLLAKKHNGEIKTEYFGGLAVAVSNASRIKNDVMVTITLSIILLAAFISYFVKIRFGTLLTFLPALFGAIVSLALLYFIKGKISSIALGVGSILLGIGVDYALYILSQIKNKATTITVVRQLSFPIIICSVTTAAVFYCLIYVKTDALHDLGLFMAFSVLGAALFSIIVLPHLITFYNKGEETTQETSQRKFVEWFSTFRFDKNKIIVGSVIVATIIFLFTSRLVEFDSDMLKMSYTPDKLKVAERNLNRISSASLKNVYLISSGKNLNEALVNNEKAYRIINDLKRKNVIKGFSSISSLLISDSAQVERIKIWNNYWTKDKKEKLKKNLIEKSRDYHFNENAFDGFYSMLDRNFTTLIPAESQKLRRLFLDNWIIDSDSSTLIINILKVDDSAKKKVYSAFAGNRNLILGDKQYLTNQLINTLKIDFNLLVDLSSYLVLLLLILALGRIELGLITFIPIMISWIWTLGIMGIWGIKFTIFNIIISTLIFGTGVDYCILIMRGLQQEYSVGKKNLHMFKSGIFLSAATTIIGVGVLLFAQHPSLHSIALLPIIGFLSVVLITFTIEPLFIKWLMLDKKKKGTYPITILTLVYTIFAYTYFLSGCFALSVTGFLFFYTIPISRKAKEKLFHSALKMFCKSMIYVMVNVKKKVINEHSEDFNKPAVIICNHQSVLDILLMLMLSPKIILLTNDWVWNSPLFGKVVQFAQFYPVSSGIETSIPLLEAKVKEGFSIAVFPEGTRSVDARINRFHKGAFYIAEKLNLDILPIMFHGTKDTIKKGELSVRNGSLTVKIYERIHPTDVNYGSTYSDRTKSICKFYRNEFQKLRYELETPDYFKDKLIKNYIYKETILEWYLRIKLKIENNYKFFDELIPKDANVTDIGCGYGFLSYMLCFTSQYRNITGIDYDQHKIDTANNCFSKNQNINFICADVKNHNLPKSDVFIMFDVLHYLPYNHQEQLIERCIENLNENGTIIIRDANSSLANKHFYTKVTEFFSTRLGFNKTGQNKMYFIPRDFILNLAEKNNVDVQLLDNAKITSNEMFILKKN